MAICKCGLCGKPFNSIGSTLCADCMVQLDESFIKVRKYIYQSSTKSDFTSIVENTEVSEKVLRILISQGRVNIDHKGGSGVKCRVCGTMTSSGVLCEQCNQRLMSQDFASAVSKEKKVEKAARPAVTPLSSYKKD